MKYINARAIITRLILIMALFGNTLFLGWAQVQKDPNLALFAQDVRIEERSELGGFFLYIRKKDSINSVLLTESSETPSKDSNTYAFRTLVSNNINGNEKRVLNGRFIKPRSGYFIVDSTPEPDLKFVEAFVLFLPYEIQYGYESTRNGILNLRTEGVYMSIRTFEQPYADYIGNYVDNSFVLERSNDKSTAFQEPIDQRINQTSKLMLPNNTTTAGTNTTITNSSSPTASQRSFVTPGLSVAAAPATTSAPATTVAPATTAAPTSVDNTPFVATAQPMASELDANNKLEELLNLNSTDKYSPDTINNFNDIAKRSNGKALYVRDKNDIVDKINAILTKVPRGTSKDVLIVLDTTRSMWDDLAVIQNRLLQTLEETMRGEIYRIGLVLYRDVEEEYVTKRIEFNDQIETIQRNLNETQAVGGGDWPEAVYEALEIAIINFTWVAERRIIFIVGDAPAHEPPDTEVDIDRMYTIAASKELLIYPMIVPRRE